MQSQLFHQSQVLDCFVYYGDRFFCFLDGIKPGEGKPDSGINVCLIKIHCGEDAAALAAAGSAGAAGGYSLRNGSQSVPAL